jgi:hypothetical protein
MFPIRNSQWSDYFSLTHENSNLITNAVANKISGFMTLLFQRQQQQFYRFPVPLTFFLKIQYSPRVPQAHMVAAHISQASTFQLRKFYPQIVHWRVAEEGYFRISPHRIRWFRFDPCHFQRTVALTIMECTSTLDGRRMRTAT